MREASFFWVAFRKRASIRAVVDHPAENACASCRQLKKHRCECGAAVSTLTSSSTATAGDLSILCGLTTIFCSTECVHNTYLPTSAFPHLCLWLRERSGRTRFVRAVDIFGEIAGRDEMLVDNLLRAYGQHGAPKSFSSRWARVDVAEQFCSDNNGARGTARSNALLMRCRCDVVGRPAKQHAPAVTVRDTSVMWWGDLRNSTHRRYPEERRAMTAVFCLSAARNERLLATEADGQDVDTTVEADEVRADGGIEVV